MKTPFPEEPIDPSDSPDNLEIRSKVRDAILKLPTNFQQVIVMRYVENLGYEAIAAQLHVPTNTVGTWLSRALKLLRVILKDLAD